MIAESLNIAKTVVLRILKEGLGKSKLWARFVAHCLALGQREDRVTSCKDNIAMTDADKQIFCNKIRKCLPILTQKMLQPFITPRNLHIYLRQTISVPQSENEVKRTPLCRCC